MTLRALLRALGAYVLLVTAACLAVHHAVALRPNAGRPLGLVASVWEHGQLVAQAWLPREDAHDPKVDAARETPSRDLVYERIVAESPILARPDLALSLSLAPAHDGIAATLAGRTAYVTADELLAHQAYDHGPSIGAIGLTLGVDTARIWALLAERLDAGVTEVRSSARLRRVRFARTVVSRASSPAVERGGGAARTNDEVTPSTLSSSVVREALLDAARYLARGVHDDGRFRYLVQATTNRTLRGYDWPRHAGATYFLAQAAALSHEPELAMACLRAAALMREGAMNDCGGALCVGSDPRVDLGSSALALLAFAEIARTGLDTSYLEQVRGLARFLRAQQRPDGEFMHEYDRDARHPIDVQYVYYSGEASFALARAHGLTRDAEDLDAARRGLAHLVGPAWSFFGDRYFFGEEHWTCQAMSELWDRVPDPKALDFCVRWQAFGRRLQQRAGDAVYDADGALGIGPMVTPRLTPVASRCEAGIATLDVLLRVGASAEEEAIALDDQLRRSLSLLLRQQLRPGPEHLFADPAAVYGAMPGSEVDLELRIDYAQHAGSAMVRWLALGQRP